MAKLSHFRSPLTYFFEGSAWFAKLGKEIGEILPSEFPFEWPAGVSPVVLKIEESLGHRIEIEKIIGCQHLALDD